AEVVLIGEGPERARAEALALRAGARLAWRDQVPLASLPAELAAAAVVLGVFGASQKAAMVMPNKVWQAAAAGRPLVTRDGPALREGLRPGEHCLACPPADPAALAAAAGRCGAAVRAQERPPAEVIVVDSASRPPERARLGAAHGGRPGVRLLLLDENRQFAGGLNAGATTAIAAGAERLLLLNNDTVLAPDALGRLAAALEARPRAGIAGPRLMDLREPGRELSAGERHALPFLCLPRAWLPRA